MNLLVMLALAVTVSSAPAPDVAQVAAEPMIVADSPCVAAEIEVILYTPVEGYEASDAVEIEVGVGAPEVAPATPAAKPRRGFCRCSCSFVPNCSTSAECGGGLCLKGPTCC